MQPTNLALAVGTALFLAACGGGDDPSGVAPDHKPDASYKFNEYIPLPDDLSKAADELMWIDIEEDTKIGSRIAFKGTRLDVNSLPFGAVQPMLKPGLTGNWYIYHTPLSMIILSTSMGKTKDGNIVHRSVIKDIKGVWSGKEDFQRMLDFGGKAKYYGVAFNETAPMQQQTGTFQYDIDFASRTGQGYIYGINSVGDPLFDKRGQLLEDAPTHEGATTFQANLNRIILDKAKLEPFRAKYADNAEREVYGVHKGSAIGLAEKGAIVNKEMYYSFALLGPKAQEIVGGVLQPVKFPSGAQEEEKYYALTVPFSGVRVDNVTNEQIQEYNERYLKKQQEAAKKMDELNMSIVNKRQSGAKDKDSKDTADKGK